ncbi:unnamed protein product, partial [Bubo scandiacus]
MARAPPRGGDSALGSSLFTRPRSAARRTRTGARPETAPRGHGRPATAGRAHGTAEGRREGGRTGRPNADRTRGRRHSRTRNAAAPPPPPPPGARRVERGGEGGGEWPRGGHPTAPRRARQHGTVPPRYPPADSRPRGRPGARPAPLPPNTSSASPPPRPARPARPSRPAPAGRGSAKRALRERGASERSP